LVSYSLYPASDGSPEKTGTFLYFAGTTNSSASASGKDQTKALRLDKKNVFQCDSSLALN
jgi:hypothetical protein